MKSAQSIMSILLFSPINFPVETNLSVFVRLTAKWKSVDLEHQEDSTMGDFPYLEWLARDYQQRGEKSGLWTDYLKVLSAYLKLSKSFSSITKFERVQMFNKREI